jgi:hypothetical protein
MLNYYGKKIFMYFLSPINVSISELDVHHLLLKKLTENLWGLVDWKHFLSYATEGQEVKLY